MEAIVETTIRCTRCRATGSSAWRSVITTTLLRNQDRPRPPVYLCLTVSSDDVFLAVPPVEKSEGNLPRLQDGLGENGAGIARCALLASVITAHTDHEKERQLQIIDDIPQGIA